MLFLYINQAHLYDSRQVKLKIMNVSSSWHRGYMGQHFVLNVDELEAKQISKLKTLMFEKSQILMLEDWVRATAQQLLWAVSSLLWSVSLKSGSWKDWGSRGHGWQKLISVRVEQMVTFTAAQIAEANAGTVSGYKSEYGWVCIAAEAGPLLKVRTNTGRNGPGMV